MSRIGPSSVLEAEMPGAPSTNVTPLFADGEVPDGALVRAAREGQSWAQEALFKRYAPVLLGQAWRLLPTDDPEDLAQDALVTALTSLDKLGDPQAFAAWASAILVRQVMTTLRRRRLLQRFWLYRGPALDAEQVAATAEPELRLELRRVYAVLDTLAPEERTALVLRRIEGLELAEVATQMGLSLATVKRRIAAAELALNQLPERGPR